MASTVRVPMLPNLAFFLRQAAVFRAEQFIHSYIYLGRIAQNQG